VHPNLPSPAADGQPAPATAALHATRSGSSSSSAASALFARPSDRVQGGRSRSRRSGGTRRRPRRALRPTTLTPRLAEVSPSRSRSRGARASASPGTGRSVKFSRPSARRRAETRLWRTVPVATDDSWS
jgi:hypothetical protein